MEHTNEIYYFTYLDRVVFQGGLKNVNNTFESAAKSSGVSVWGGAAGKTPGVVDANISTPLEIRTTKMLSFGFVFNNYSGLRNVLSISWPPPPWLESLSSLCRGVNGVTSFRVCDLTRNDRNTSPPSLVSSCHQTGVNTHAVTRSAKITTAMSYIR